MDALTNAFGPAMATLVRGEGCYVWDKSGKKYLDFLAGIAVNALGHAHPALVDAVSKQVETLGHISNFFVSQPQIDLAERLAELADLGEGTRTFFSNSGAEANEAALKMVRLHGRATDKDTIVALEGSFHGRTMGALALTWTAAYREPFEPLPGGIVHVPATPEALREAFQKHAVAGVFLEPVQGEAGVLPLPETLIEVTHQLATENNALLVVDEVQTGIGRTGTWFAHHVEGDSGPVRADIVTLAKGLGGGIPIGATVAGPRAAELLYPGSHGSTFGGNPLACNAALAVLDVIETQDLLQNAVERGQGLRRAILGLNSPLIKEITGDGLLLGIQLNQPVAKEIQKRAFELGLIINAPRTTTLRVAPPLIVGDEEIKEFTPIFKAALQA